jgi:hypothetical protein
MNEVMSCVFSVELESKNHVKNIIISDESFDRVFFEGDLGKLSELSIVESSSLEILGGNGILRIEVDSGLLSRVLERPDQVLSLGSEVKDDCVCNKEES